jgi:hypothetical protein
VPTRIGRRSGRKPKLARTLIPGTFWEAIVTRKSGQRQAHQGAEVEGRAR